MHLDEYWFVLRIKVANRGKKKKAACKDKEILKRKLYMGQIVIHITNESQIWFLQEYRIMTKKNTYRANSGSHFQHGKNWQKDILQNCNHHIY